MGEKEHHLRAIFGYEGATIAREWAICTLTYLDESAKSFVIPNTLNHPLTRDHLIVNNPPYIRSYAAANIFFDGVKVGTFCICDLVPREFSQRDIELLVDMAACVSEMLTSRKKRWIQDHVSGIALSTDILSSIKPPLERVDEDMQSIHETVINMEISEPPTSPLRTQSDAELLTDCDPAPASGQTTLREEFSRQLRIKRLEGEVEHLRDDVMRLGKAIDFSLHQMLELSLHGRTAQLSSPSPSSKRSRSRSSSASLAMERSDDTSITLSFMGLPLSPREKFVPLDSSIESPHDVRVIRREPVCNQMFDIWIGSHDNTIDGCVVNERDRSEACHRSLRPPRPRITPPYTSQRLGDEESFPSQTCCPLDSLR